MIKLNVGCGHNILDGYENIDLYVSDLRIRKADIRNLPYDDNTVDEVLAEDILEHFPRLEWKGVLAEWVRVLKPGGTIVLKFPEMRWLCEQLLAAKSTEEWDFYNRKIFGGQGDGKGDGKGMFHYTGFSKSYLQAYCQEVLNMKYVSHEWQNFNCTLVMQK